MAIYNEHIPFLRNDISHSETRIAAHWPSHFGRPNTHFKLQHKAKQKPRKRPILPSFEEGTEKSSNNSLRDIVIQWIYAHTHTLATHRERFAITFWKEKISSKGLNFKKK